MSIWLNFCVKKTDGNHLLAIKLLEHLLAMSPSQCKLCCFISKWSCVTSR